LIAQQLVKLQAILSNMHVAAVFRRGRPLFERCSGATQFTSTDGGCGRWYSLQLDLRLSAQLPTGLHRHRALPGASRVAQIHHRLVEKEFLLHGPGKPMFGFCDCLLRVAERSVCSFELVFGFAL